MGAAASCDAAVEVGDVGTGDEGEVEDGRELVLAADGVEIAAVADSGKGCEGLGVCAAVCAGCEDPPNHVLGDQEILLCCTYARCAINCGRIVP